MFPFTAPKVTPEQSRKGTQQASASIYTVFGSLCQPIEESSEEGT